MNHHQRRSHRLLIRLFGRHRIPKELWDFHPRSLRGGLCLGVFVGFTPTIPFHMIIAAIAAVFLRVNLPLALLGCWVSNPLTLYHIYRYEYLLGHAILERIPAASAWISFHPDEGTLDKILTGSLSLTVGCLLMGTAAAALAWLFSGLILRLLGVTHHPRPEQQAEQPLKTSDPACDIRSPR
ncbi:MAG: DUF2062 domain-containing protein [Phycisphaerae bacterium]|nr:DUF2062 domain-containing protein [Phycisphaerae bacterium]